MNMRYTDSPRFYVRISAAKPAEVWVRRRDGRLLKIGVPYWDVVVYDVVVARDGHYYGRARWRARRVYSTRRAAERAAQELAARLNCPVLQSLGRLSQDDLVALGLA